MSATEQIKAYLLSGKSLTKLECLIKFGSFNLQGRVWDMEREGMKIDRKPIFSNGKRYLSYFINFNN
jgi:hypothetical protein